MDIFSDEFYNLLMKIPAQDMLYIDCTGHDLVERYLTPSQINLENTVISMI